jgi:MraZ protein
LAQVRSGLNRFNAAEQMVYRKLVSEAQELQLDANGRILLPKHMLERVGIEQDVLFVGMEQTIEIWALQNAAVDNDQAFMTDDDFAAKLKKFMTE